jgi:glutathione S-transferase
MIQLYGTPVSRAQRSLWALEEVGVEYENIPTHFIGESKTPEHLARNPNGRIPVLVDGDLILWESMAINLYLAKRYDKGLQPKTLADEAHALKWSFWVMTEVETHLITVLMHRLMLPKDQKDAKIADAAVEKLAKPFAVLDAALAERKYILGDTYSVADVNVASVLATGSMVQVEFGDYPNLERWMSVCTARAACKTARGLMGG